MSRIKEARLNAGLTQEQMTSVLGIPRRTVQNWEKGVAKPPEYVERLVIAELERLQKSKEM